jgi:hypothetical protein
VGLIYAHIARHLTIVENLCVRSRLISVSISMSRKGDRMDTVRVQLIEYGRACMHGIRSHDQRHRNCAPVAYVGLRRLRHTNIYGV